MIFNMNDVRDMQRYTELWGVRVKYQKFGKPRKSCINPHKSA